MSFIRLWIIFSYVLLAFFVLAAATPPLQAATSPTSGYVAPTTGLPYATGVLRAFDKPERNWLPGHRGVDLLATPGSQIVAAQDGEVSFAGVVAGTATISIVHPDGIRTTYQPVRAQLRVGDRVYAGQPIGYLTGHEGLHWGALQGKDDYINPLTLLNSPTIRLKPVDEPDRKRLSSASR